ncbi:MAG: hypothetical protein LAO76_25310 [Acidobacteriia bacterium]|nr:hypothetical protein [Terriglobia bacterium]
MNFIIDKTKLKPGLIIFRRGDATSASGPGAAAAGSGVGPTVDERGYDFR